MHDETLRTKLVEVFGNDVGRVIKFLETGRFSEGGEAAIAGIFLGALEAGINAKQIADACNKEWPEVWIKQPIAVRGNPDAVGPVGKANQDAIARIRAVLGIAKPC